MSSVTRLNNTEQVLRASMHQVGDPFLGFVQYVKLVPINGFLDGYKEINRDQIKPL
jgi:hypothetical protein